MRSSAILEMPYLDVRITDRVSKTSCKMSEEQIEDREDQEHRSEWIQDKEQQQEEKDRPK